MKPKLVRMREGKDGGGKGPLVTEDMSLTLTGVQDILFQPTPDGHTPPSSPESEGSISGSNEQDGARSPSARSRNTPPTSSPSDGQGSQTSETSPDWWVTSGEEMIDGSGYHRERLATDVTPTLNGYSTPLVGKMPSSGPVDSLVKTSVSPASEEVSPVTDPVSPSPSSGFWTDSEMSPSDGSFSKTFKGFSTHMADGTWRNSRVRWGTSGMGGPTDAWTASTSMCRSAGSECSSSPTRLADLLIPTAPPRFSLSARAAEGILRRASKRGRRLPPVLEAALQALCESTTAPAPTPTTPSSVRSSSGTIGGPTPKAQPVGTSSSDTESQQMVLLPLEPSPPQQDTTGTPSEPKTQTEDFSKSVTGTGQPMPSPPSGPTAEDQQETSTTTLYTPRRLTPLETELLMGWPPGHTISRTYSRRGSTGTDSGLVGMGSYQEKPNGSGGVYVITSKGTLSPEK